jgi:PKD repeat protein
MNRNRTIVFLILAALISQALLRGGASSTLALETATVETTTTSINLPFIAPTHSPNAGSELDQQRPIALLPQAAQATRTEQRPELVEGLLEPPPVPMPHDCDGFTPPGGDLPACCVYGYVYYNGVPVIGADVQIESLSGTLSITTDIGIFSTTPYYAADLDISPLSVSPGDFITVTATVSGSMTSTVYQVAPEGQQLDAVLFHSFDDWWDSAYAYRRPLPISTGDVMAAGTVVKMNELDLESLVSAGKARADYGDIRVARRISEHNWEEIARVIYTNWDLEFKLADPINPGTDTSYYMYYGNPDAGSPPTFSIPQGWWVDMYTDKWWEEYVGTWEFDAAMDFEDVCHAPLDHDARTGDDLDESDKFRGRLFIPHTGDWTFHLYTRDGYRVIIEGSERARFDGYDDNRWVTAGSMYLKAGWHHMELRNMWVQCGAWKFAMEGPSFPNQIVPASYFQVWERVKGIAPGDEESPLLHYPPITTIHTIYPNPAVQGQDMVTFRGSAVDNDEDGASIVQYAWRSNLDGGLSAQATFTLTADDLSAGVHTIYFTAQDDEGVWADEIATTLTVNPDQGSPPVATFSITPTVGYTATAFLFDASGSSDAQDPPAALEVRWDWEDDGNYDTAWSTTKTLTHTFPSTGTYTVRLQARDTDGHTDATTHNAFVTGPNGATGWLFMLYLDGDNNLHGWMQRALDRLEAATANADLTIVVLLDGYGYGNTWRYHVQPDGQYVDGVNRWDMGELDMSHPQTLRDFVTWARGNYPAAHTYLAVADHGRGSTGIAWDDTSGSDEFISVGELRAALNEATSSGAAPLDVLHYDACLMAMLENAYQVKDFAANLVVSENLGWSIFAYDRYAAQVTANTTPAQLASAIVEEYDSALDGYPRTLSALDLGQAGAVADAVTALASALRANLDANKYHVRNTRDAAQKFDSQDYLVIDVDDEYLDLYDLARLLQQNIPDSAVQSAAQGVMDAVTALVVAERHASGYYQDYPYWDLDDAHGVSIYFPPVSGGWDYGDYMGHIFRFTAEGGWDEFLLDYYGLLGLPPDEPTDPGLPPVLNQPASVSKAVTPQGQVEYGDLLTYTLAVSATPNAQVKLYDPLTGTTFVRFVEPVPGITHTNGAITGTLAFSSSEQVTVSFVAQVDVPGTAGMTVDVTNRACVYLLGGTLDDCVWSDEVTNPASRPYGVYLPAVVRQ